MSARHEYRNRIRGVRSIRQITQVMKAVSLARAGRAQTAVLAARPYDRLLHEVVRRIAGSAHRVSHPLLEIRDVRQACFVVITADRGLSGGFDVPILRRALEEAKAYPAARFVAVGRKAVQFMSYRGLDTIETFVDLDEDVHIKDARTIASHVIDGYVKGNYDRVLLIYSELVSFLEHRTAVLPLIPVPITAEQGRVQAPGGEAPVNYIFEPGAEEVLKTILPMFIEEAVFHALTESKASEYSARLAAMDGASRNADEIIERLTLQLHRSRQAAITGELLEIVASTAALE